MKILFWIFNIIAFISISLAFYVFIIYIFHKLFSFLRKSKEEERNLQASIILPTSGLKKENLKSFLFQIYDSAYEILFTQQGSEDFFLGNFFDRAIEFPNVSLGIVSYSPEPHTVNLSSIKVEGSKKAKGDVIVLVNANSTLDSKHLSQLIKPMKNEKTGAVFSIPEYNFNEGKKYNIVKIFFEASFWNPLFISLATLFRCIHEGFVAVKKNFIRNSLNDRFIKNRISVESEFIREVRKKGGKVEFIKKNVPVDIQFNKDEGIVDFLNYYIVSTLNSTPPLSYIPLFITLGFPVSLLSLIIAIWTGNYLFIPLFLIGGNFICKFISNLYLNSIYRKKYSTILKTIISIFLDFPLIYFSIKALLKPIVKIGGKKYLVQKGGIGVPLQEGTGRGGIITNNW